MIIANSYRAPRGALLGLSNAKTPKGESLGYLTAIMYLAPHRLAGRGDVCPASSAACRAGCLFSAGRGAMANTRDARIKRTHLFFDDKPRFMRQLFAEIAALEALATNHDMRLAVRLNGTSDIPWERIRSAISENIFADFPDVQFYDYTKRIDRLKCALPQNYALTFSLDGMANYDDARTALALGAPVACIVSRGDKALLEGYGMVDGDADDARFLNRGIVLLTPKGEARKARNAAMLTPASAVLALHMGARHAQAA